MKDKWEKKNKTELFNDRIKQRKEKAAERARLFEEAGKPVPNVKKDENAPSTSAPRAKPQPPATPAPKQTVKDSPNRPGKAEREQRGRRRSGGYRF